MTEQVLQYGDVITVALPAQIPQGREQEGYRYALMQVGWDRGRRVRGNLVYITVQHGQVWIEYDGMEQGIAQNLIQGGIEPERIVLKFVSEAGSPITPKLEYVG